MRKSQFYLGTYIQLSTMVISHVYCHLVVTNGNFICLLTSQHPIASQHKKTNKVVWTCKDNLTPPKTTTYKRPFTREGTYLVYSIGYYVFLYHYFLVGSVRG